MRPSTRINAPAALSNHAKLRYAWRPNSLSNWQNDTLAAPLRPSVSSAAIRVAHDNPNDNVQMVAGSLLACWQQENATLWETAYSSLQEKFMRPSLPGFHLPLWAESPMPPKVATLLAVAGILCVLLSTVFGVSPISHWLLYAAQVLLGHFGQ